MGEHVSPVVPSVGRRVSSAGRLPVRVPSLMSLFLYVFATTTADFFLFSGMLLSLAYLLSLFTINPPCHALPLSLSVDCWCVRSCLLPVRCYAHEN
jgi:hypothetical protein